MQCFNADATTGVIRYAGNEPLAGHTVQDCGLSENSLRDGYMDFGVVDGIRRFIITLKQENIVFYYALDLNTMFGHTLLYTGITMALFALAVAVVLMDMFRGYNDAVYASWAVVCLPGEDPQALLDAGKEARRAHEKHGDMKPDENHGIIRGLAERLIRKATDVTRWRDRTPEEKTGLVFQTSLLVLLISWANLLLSKNMVYSKYDSLAGFLLQGDWMRGGQSLCLLQHTVGHRLCLSDQPDQ